MPYIHQDIRKDLDPHLKKLGELINTEGELNYAITCLAVMRLKKLTPNYAHINQIMGVFACATQEFYRRIAVPYEESKKFQNGDAY